MLREIIWLQPDATGRRFPYVECAAEGDQEQDWTYPLVGIEKLDLMLATILPEEIGQYKWMRPEQPGLRLFQDRINAQLRRTDLRATWRFITAEHWIKTDGEWTLKEPPSQPNRGYADVFAPGRHARLLRRESVDAFVADGGLLTRLPDA